MTTIQKVIKYLAIALAVLLAVSIIGGIMGAFGIFGALFANDAVTDEIKTYEISDDIRELDIKVNAADLTIKTGDAFSVESNLKYLKVSDEGGKLSVKDTTKHLKNYANATLTVTIPEDTVFEKIDITTGACKLSADSLSAEGVKLELGAGDVTIESLVATKYADVDGGAGRIKIGGGAICDLDLDMGVGKLQITSALTGKCELDMGVGDAEITVSGNRDDYALSIEKGVGTITVDGKEVSVMNEKGGDCSIDIDGGVGKVKLDFAESVEGE